jgi:hypothetical protein
MSRRDYYHPPRWDGDDDPERERLNDEWVKYSEKIRKARDEDLDTVQATPGANEPGTSR